MTNLTIAIPTYNRKEKLLETLKKLNEELRIQEVEILIIDNNSNDSNKEELKTLKNLKVKYIKNKFNVGMSANFMKCFEFTETKWMWLLSDDDYIRKGCINIVLNDIKKNRDVSLIKYSLKNSYQIEENIYMGSLKEVVEYLADKKKTDNFMFISTSIYNLENFKDVIQFGYQYANTFVPHLMMTFYLLYSNKNSKIMFNKQLIVDCVPPTENERYSIYVSSLGLGANKNFPFNLDKITMKKLDRIFLHYAVRWHLNFLNLYLFGLKENNFRLARKIYTTLYFLSYEHLNVFEKVIYKLLIISMRNIFPIRISVLKAEKILENRFGLKFNLDLLNRI